MANSVPLRWMRGTPPKHPRRPQPAPLPLPCPQPAAPPPPPPKQNPGSLPQLSQLFGDLSGRLQHMDAETLLLLALLWMLWQEKANPRLLLALAYIAL